MTRIDILYEQHSGTRLQVLRGRVLRACVEAGIDPHWHEWNIGHDHLPDSLAVYGSTTVLVNGVDVMSVGNTLFERMYRFIDFFDGGSSIIPSGRKISQALAGGQGRSSVSKRSHQLLSFTLLPLFLVSFYFEYLCPVCGGAVSNLSTGASGLKGFMGALLPAMLFSLMLAASGFLYRARERHGYKPFFFGLAGLLLIIAGRFFLHYDSIYMLGVAVMLIASLWNAKPAIYPPLPDCPRCACAKVSSSPETGEERQGTAILQ